MKHFLLLGFICISYVSFAAKPSPPPLDSSKKDYCYYFDYPFTSPKSWDSTLFFTKRFFDSLYFEHYKIIGIDSVSQTMKIRITSKLHTRGMLKNTHKPVYSNCYMTFDYIIHYTPTGLQCKVKRIVHYYTFTTESSYMGNTNGKKTMRTESERVEIPMIQTDVKFFTKKVLAEVNEDITESINSFKSYKWNYKKPETKKKNIEDDDY
jgi:hypothetical protein